MHIRHAPARAISPAAVSVVATGVLYMSAHRRAAKPNQYR